MNVFCKQTVRTPVFSLLTVLLLAFSVALSCIGLCARTGAKRQKDKISAGYTTIAVPVMPDLGGLSAEQIAAALQMQVYADKAAQELPQIKAIDRRCLLSAAVADCRSLSSGRVDPAEYNAAFDGECYSLAVFALRCGSVREQPTDGQLLYDAAFHVEDIVCLSDAYDVFPRPDQIHICSDVRTADGALPFESGKTYLVFGQYQDYRVVRTADGYRQVTAENRYLVPFPEIRSNVYGEPSSLASGGRDGHSYRFPAAGQLPWFAAYTGTAAGYLGSAAAAVWRDTIVPLCRINHRSAAVILTDRIASMYAFNTGENTLLSGRFFTDEETASGADVCIISAAWAEENGLRLGDTVRLDLYDSSFGEYSNGATANTVFAAGDPGPYRQRYVMRPDDAIGVSKSYTVVGLYTGVRFAFGAYAVNADTIFVPKASVPDAQKYETRADPLLNTFILQNGSADAFEKAMERQGLGGQFLYFDQGFSSMQGTLDAMENNALRLAAVGIGTVLLMSALFLFLHFRRMRPAIRIARRIGHPTKTTGREIFTALILQESLAVLLGTGIAAALFTAVTKDLLSDALTLRPGTLAAAAGGTLVFLAAVTASAAAIVTRRRLMKDK